MKRFLRVLFPVLLILAAGNTVYALTGDEILAKVEQSLTGPDDYEAIATMILANNDGSRREERSLKLWISGTEKRVIKFLSPAGVKGIGLLTESSDSMYLYLPAQNKIRRIEGQNKNDDFQGTDFSYNEMGSYEYKKDYSAELTKEEDKSFTLTLTKKAGADKPYDTMVMIVDKSDFIPHRMELYQKGVLKKIITLAEIQKTGKYRVPVRVKIENVIRGHSTEMIMSDIKFDQKLAAGDTFSKRFLKKKP